MFNCRTFGHRLKHAIIYLLFLLTTVWFAGWVMIPAGQTITHGFAAYFTAAQLLSRGQLPADIYAPDYFRPLVRQITRGQAEDIYHANPPTAALLLLPLSRLTAEQARVAWVWTNAAMLWAGLGLLAWTFRPRAPGATTAVALTLGMLFRPAIANIRFGQAYLAVFLLLTLTVAALYRSRPKIGGAMLGFSLLLKTAGWGLLPLATRKQYRGLLVGVILVTALILLLTLPVLPPSLWRQYLQQIPALANSPYACVPAYQTTRSLLCRLPGRSNEAALAGNLVYISLAISTLATILTRRRTRLATTANLLIVWELLFKPVGELHHHAVLLIPFGWLLFNWRRLDRLEQLSTEVAGLAYLLPLPLNLPPYPQGAGALVSYPYVFAAWLLFLTLYRQKLSPGSETDV